MVTLLERHWLSTILKNYGLRTLIHLMPKYLALKALKTIWLVSHGKPHEKLAVLKSILWNLYNLRDTWKKRVEIQISRKLSDTEIQKRMSKQSFEFLLWLGKLMHPISEYYQ